MKKIYEILSRFKLGEISSESAKNELAKLVILGHKNNIQPKSSILLNASNLSLNSERDDGAVACSRSRELSNKVKLSKLSSLTSDVNCLEQIAVTNPAILDRNHHVEGSVTLSQFPELVHLNQSTLGRPVFWIHGALGDVHYYSELAGLSERPFYGIQMRGRIGNRYPLYGMQAMAAYYIHIIQSVQPNGPYDVGGYSGGGTIAYEVSRQLQELGQTVDSVVMLDTVLAKQFEDVKIYSTKSILLTAVNWSIMAKIPPEQRSDLCVLEKQIHHKDVGSNLNEPEYLNQLLSIAKTKGLIQNERMFQAEVERSIRILKAYDNSDYVVHPLLVPEKVQCYYFRNKSGVYYIEQFRPYWLADPEEMDMDNREYWKLWEKQFPNFHMIDVDSNNHMELLRNPKSKEVILLFCKELYSRRGRRENL